MRRTGVVIAAAAIAALGACGNDDADAKQESETTATPTAVRTTTKAPSPEKTYVPAPGDPKTHDLRITIRDKGRSYDPATCTALGGQFLAFSAPDANHENSPLDETFPAPDGKRLPDGTCEASLTITLPYAPTYRTGITYEGNGIAGPDDPKETKIVTKGDAQDVELINYPV